MSRKELIQRLRQNFDDHANTVDGVEVWFARDLQKLLGYEKWQMFERVITRAEIACEESGNDPADHFTIVSKPVEAGKGAQIEIKDVLLTRYACYLIAQNGDPRKKEIAFAMTYFAVQTRKMEVLEQRFGEIERILARDELTVQEKLLAKLSFERGVDEVGMRRIRSKGDQALFTFSTSAMKRKLGVPKNRPLADFLPRVTIAGKAFAAEITNFNIEDKNLKSEREITQEHEQRNKDVRGVLLKAKITPEELPPAEDIKKVGRRVKKDEKKLTKKQQDKS
jgi:DNA-damage-inducible protein D